MTIRVVVAEDQILVLDALAALLDTEPGIEIVGKAKNGAEALRLVQELHPDILVTDVEMPELTGLDLAQRVRDLEVESSRRTRVLILTTFARPGYLRRALDAGASGYLLKDSRAEDLARAIREIFAGGRAIDPELASAAWTAPDPLSERERQVLRLAAEGLSSRAISEQAYLSEGTVRNYLSEAIHKLGAANRVEAARIAREKGWL